MTTAAAVSPGATADANLPPAADVPRAPAAAGDIDGISELRDVHCFETAAGNVRYVARDAEGREYATFRVAIGACQGGEDGAAAQRAGRLMRRRTTRSM
jgi:hypothetical protein